MGPPIDPPNWFRRNFGLPAGVLPLALGLNVFLASKKSLRTYSKMEPWKWLDPDLVMKEICPPVPVPSSAG